MTPLKVREVRVAVFEWAIHSHIGSAITNAHAEVAEALKNIAEQVAASEDLGTLPR